MKRRFTILMLLVLILSVRVCAIELDDKMLVRVLISDNQDLLILKNLTLVVNLRADGYIIATIESNNLGALKEAGYTYELLDPNAWSQQYFLITKPQDQPLGHIPEVGEIIYQQNREAIVKISEVNLTEFQQEGFKITRISAEPLSLMINEKKKLQDLHITQLSDPIITALVNRVSDASIAAMLQRLQDFQTRWSGSDSVYAASQWIYEQFKSYGYTNVVFDTLITIVEGKRQRNVIATKRGTVFPDSIIMIGGHYDSIVFDGTNSRVWAPGVDDNGTGTVAALEAARILADVDLETTVKFACWAAEEQGLIGSWDWVNKAVRQRLKIGLYINFDMIGNVNSADPLRDVSIYADQASRGFAELMSEMAMLYTTLVPQIRLYVPGGSDHYPFAQNGYNFLYGEEGDFSPNWHRSTDTIDNVEIHYTNEVIRIGLATLVQVAGPPESIFEPFVTYSSYRIDDDNIGNSKGNNNGFLDSGETIEFFINLKNVGDSIASGVIAILQTDDPFITVIDNLISYGDIASGDTATNDESFSFAISPTTPNDHAIIFSLTVKDSNNNSWDSYFLLKVLQPEIVYLGCSIKEVSGDGDNIPEPGETCDLFLTIKNNGFRQAQGIESTLSSHDPDITLIDEQATFPDIFIDSVGRNDNDPFAFHIADNALRHCVQFKLNLSEGEGYYQKQMNVTILLGLGSVLLVVDDGQADNSRFYIDAFNELGVPVVKWRVLEQGAMKLDTLMTYNDVIWFTGSDASQTLTEEDQTNLQTFLNNGGHLLLSGDFIGYRLSSTSFFSDYLHAEFVSPQTQIFHLKSVNENPVTAVDTLALERLASNWPTEIDPLSPAFSILVYDTTMSQGPGTIKSTGTAALAVDNDTFKVVYCSFKIETIVSQSTRAKFLKDVLSWFNGSPLDLSAILTVASVTIDDDSLGSSQGNGDGFINPDEHIELYMNIANKGTLTAYGVQASLRTKDKFITVIDSSVSFGKVAANMTATSSDNFVFSVDKTAPHEHIVLLEVNIMDSLNNLWADTVFVTIIRGGTAVAGSSDLSLPSIYSLQQNYPNPFSISQGGTIIKFQLPQEGHINLKIYNLLGKEVVTLVQEDKKIGYHQVLWNGLDLNGKMSASGVYFYQLKAGNFEQTKKMLIMH